MSAEFTVVEAAGARVRLKILHRVGPWGITERVSVLRGGKDEPLQDDRLALTHLPSGLKVCCGGIVSLKRLAVEFASDEGLSQDPQNHKATAKALLERAKAKRVAKRNAESDRSLWVGVVPPEWKVL